jgi:hypothetical protein
MHRVPVKKYFSLTLLHLLYRHVIAVRVLPCLRFFFLGTAIETYFFTSKPNAGPHKKSLNDMFNSSHFYYVHSTLNGIYFLIRYGAEFRENINEFFLSY